MVLGAFWSLVSAVFSRGFSLITSILVARLLGKTAYGLWGLVITTVSMFAGLASFGIAMTATRYVAELRETDPARAGRTLSLALLVSGVSLTVMSLTCVALAGVLANRAPELFIPLLLAGGALFVMVGTQILYGTLAGFEAFRTIANIGAIQGVALFLAAVPLTWCLRLPGTVIGMTLSWSLAAVLAFRAVFALCRQHRITLGLTGVWQEREVLWKCAIPSVLAGTSSGVAETLSQATVARIPGGISGLGGFTAAVRWRDIVMFVPQAVRRVVLPILSRLEGVKDRARYRKALWANMALNGAVSIAGAIPVMIFSVWILGLYGPAFGGDWDMMVILVATGVLQSINNVVAQVAVSKEKVWWVFWIHVVWGAMLVTGSYLLVPYLGVRGYVWSLSGTYLVHLLLNSAAAFILIRREDRRPPDAATEAPDAGRGGDRHG